MYFSEDEAQRLNVRIRQLEKKTGVELVAAVVGKCDNYPEIPWKAFASGVAFSSLVLLFQTMLRPDWLSPYSVLVHAIIVLAVGTIMALLTAVWPGWARCFLDRTRAASEMQQYAQSLFLEHDVFATRGRIGLVLLVGLLERQVVILTDSGLDARLPSGGLQSVIAAMTPDLKRNDRFRALKRGLSAMEECLHNAGFELAADETDQISETLIQRKGAAE